MIIVLILVVLVVSFLGAILLGSMRWSRQTKAFLAELSTAGADTQNGRRFEAADIEGLPASVQRYFRAVLPQDQSMVTSVNITQSGTFNMGHDTDQWRPFIAEQTVRPGHPGFLWDARIRIAPGVAVHVHDAFINGAGYLHGAIFGAITVMKEKNLREIDEGELLRYIAEAPWYPTALLPSSGARWEQIDERSARVTISVPSAGKNPDNDGDSRGGDAPGELRQSMVFRFTADGLIESVYADARGATVDGTIVPTPWEGHWWAWEVRHGILVPTEGEVAWLYPSGRKPYWRGKLDAIAYTTAKG